MTGHGAKFGREKEAAIAALLSQRTIDDAARFADIGPKMLLRWLQIPAFRVSYLEARRQAVGQASARLQQATGAAVSTLLKFMVDPNAPAASRIRAAACVLDQAAKSIELEDLDMRVSELERAAEVSTSERKA